MLFGGGCYAIIRLAMSTTTQIPKPIAQLLRKLTPSEVREVLRFALFLKTRAKLDLTQGYFWTKGWQRMEKAAVRDRTRGRVIGDGTLEGLLSSLH